MMIDEPETHAEIAALVERYEDALDRNDIGALDAMFWHSPQVVRFGVGENLYGEAEIAAFRRQRQGGSPPRTVRRIAITTFGRDFAVANVEFQRLGGETIGRQSQSWVRLPEGWRIVAAHVSLMGQTS
ncbi:MULTISPECIES: oxalurate catabolism protein HpxZ [unclassified Sphingobium]|uniref:oxalurate catabolism protein HpxZ n=1 Tax=unclassified Sphingobium TaxID=2611147 RepID=UPI0034227B2F